MDNITKEKHQRDSNRYFHKALENNNFPLVKYYLSGPNIPVVADINSIGPYKVNAWKFFRNYSEEIQDYLLSFDYIEDSEEKTESMKNAFKSLAHSKNIDSFKKLLTRYPDIANNDELNAALLNSIANRDENFCIALLQHQPQSFIPLWHNGIAIIHALLTNSIDKVSWIVDNTPYEHATHSRESLSGLLYQRNHAYSGIEQETNMLNDAMYYMLVQCETPVNMNNILFEDIISQAGRYSNIKLVDYLMKPNQYNDGLDLKTNDSLLITCAITNNQYPLMLHMMEHYNLRLNEIFERKDLRRVFPLENRDFLNDIYRIQDNMMLRDQLQHDLPVAASTNKRRKI